MSTSIVCLLFSLHEIWVRHPASHFFPLPLAAWLLLITRHQMLRSLHQPKNPAMFGWLVAIHLLLALAAFVLISPFLAGLAFLAASVALAAAKGRDGEDEAPAWSLPALALFLIPPPMMLDQDMHQMLAGLAARLSQGWLDAMQVLHVVQGTIVATPEKRFFVDDACSGTNSMLVAICVAVIICSFNRRTPGHAVALLAATALISITSNVLRICLMIGGLRFWGLELDHGWVHDAVGVAFFLLDLLLVWSADHGLHFIINGRPPDTGSSRWDTDVTCRPAAISAALGRMNLCVAFIGLVLLVGPEVLTLTRPAPIAQTQDGPDEFHMPEQLAGWTRSGDQPVENSMVGNLGVRNQVWVYRKDGLEAFVAINFPFQGFHDTRLCYAGQGWQFQKQKDEVLPGETKKSVRYLEMTQPTEMTRAHLWLSVVDGLGTTQEFTTGKLLGGMGERLLTRWSNPGPEPTTYVVQVLTVEPETDDWKQSAFTELLAEARGRMADALSNHSPQSAEESE
ncbi:exosortase U [Prosthecobacter sp.]|uniref:exosortase U n=1 Tax=Prosthecobacter sp. TaxID=1965333 RepID=UPI001D3A1EAA|nr:exosortase U [Prosthecobacter sp.]MCB1278003.1 exosortase U [Prosthecobacter sp.]